MGTINTSLPTDGTTADTSDYNTPINTIVSEFNGNIDNANIKASAAIATAKLADDAGITTAKIAPAAVTSEKLAPTFYQKVGLATNGIAATEVDINSLSVVFTPTYNSYAYVDWALFVDITSTGTVDAISNIHVNGAVPAAGDDYIPGRFIGTGSGVRAQTNGCARVTLTAGTAYTIKVRAIGTAGQTFNTGPYSFLKILVTAR